MSARKEYIRRTMKIASFGLNIAPGKYKYNTDYFDKLVEKFSPQKVSPFNVEFIGEDLDKADAVVYNPDKKFDFLFIDIDKVDRRLSRVESGQEKDVLEKAARFLEKQVLLSEADFSAQEKEILKPLAFVTYKPCVGKAAADDMNSLIGEVIDKAGLLLFFTAGKKEVHAWDIKKGQTALDAAARIHSDLARGFIKADVVNSSQLDNFFNIQEAKSRGFMKLVDRDYVMQDADIIEVRFNV